MKKLIIATCLLFASSISAADYVIDTKGAHASINFKVKHLGYSWLTGRFNTFEGSFSYDENNLAASNINVSIDTKSVDSNHAERDKHLRGKKFLNVKKHDKATFVSKSVKPNADGTFIITGDLTLNGVTKSIDIAAHKIGEGKDPWGGYRAGFSGTTSIAMKDYKFKNNYGDIELSLHVEGIRK